MFYASGILPLDIHHPTLPQFGTTIIFVEMYNLLIACLTCDMLFEAPFVRELSDHADFKVHIVKTTTMKDQDSCIGP